MNPSTPPPSDALVAAVAREKREPLPEPNPAIEDSIDRAVMAVIRIPAPPQAPPHERRSLLARAGAAVRTAISLAALTGIGTFAILASDRSLPVDQIANITTGVVRPAGPMVLASDVFRHRLCSTTVEFSIFDSAPNRHFLPDLDIRVPVRLGRDHFQQELKWSAPLAPGPATLYVGLIWRCNPVHWLWPITNAIEVPFEVVP